MPTSSTVPGSTALIQAACSGRVGITDVGRITTPAITEVSGLVAGRQMPPDGSGPPWWVHNDSGGGTRVFAIDTSGALLATVDLTGVRPGDWEDIAGGPGVSRSDPPLLYVGDIGNNHVIAGGLGSSDTIRIQRFDEPTVPSEPPSVGGGPPNLKVSADTIELRYPDGPHDAEAMVVDPLTGDLVLVTKDWSLQGRSGVYRVGGIAQMEDGATATLVHVATVQLPPGTLVTGADVTGDGTVVGLRSYGAVDLYRRNPDEPLWSAFEQAPCVAPAPQEQQGESIGFAPDGGSYLTASEGRDPVLHRTAP